MSLSLSVSIFSFPFSDILSCYFHIKAPSLMQNFNICNIRLWIYTSLLTICKWDDEWGTLTDFNAMHSNLWSSFVLLLKVDRHLSYSFYFCLNIKAAIFESCCNWNRTSINSKRRTENKAYFSDVFYQNFNELTHKYCYSCHILS